MADVRKNSLAQLRSFKLTLARTFVSNHRPRRSPMLPLRMKTVDVVPRQRTPAVTSSPPTAPPVLDPLCDCSLPSVSVSVDAVPLIRRNTCAVAIEHAARDNTQLYLALLPTDLRGQVNAYLLWRGWHTHGVAKQVHMPEVTAFGVSSTPSYFVTDEGELLMFCMQSFEDSQV